MATPGYAKDIKEVLRECDEAFVSIQRCAAYDGTICSPNAADMAQIALARNTIREYFELRGIKFD